MKFVKDSKEVLARLLAEERLNVVFRKVKTASFNLKERLLTLPMLETDKRIVDWFVAHEVSHALFTPEKEYLELALKYGDIANIVEDIRVNTKICKRYPGITRLREIAYKLMFDGNFYGTAMNPVTRENVNDLPFPDRINIHFKVGKHAGVMFSDDEQKIVDVISGVSTWRDVVTAVKMLYEFMKNNTVEKRASVPENNPSAEFDGDEFEPVSNGEVDEGENETENEDEPYVICGDDESDDDTDETESVDGSGDSSDDSDIELGDDEPIDSVTVNNESSSFISIAEDDTPNVYNKYIKKIDNLHHYMFDRKDFIDACMQTVRHANSYTINRIYDNEEFDAFYAYNKKVVSDAAQTFLINRMIDTSAPEMVYHSGVLDTNNLYSYRYNDDIFLREIVVQENSDSHGLLLFVDFSQSMESYFHTVIKQLLLLVMFAQEANIPFQVYGFTYFPEFAGVPVYKGDEDEFCFTTIQGNSKKFLVELFNDSMPNAEFNRMMKFLFWYSSYIQTTALNNYSAYSILNSTPLNLTLHVAKQIGEEFKNTRNIQKLNVVFITDGESDNTEKTIDKFNSVNTVYLTDYVAKTTKTVKRNHEVTQVLVENLEEYLGCSVYNYFLTISRNDEIRNVYFSANLWENLVSWMVSNGECLVRGGCWYSDQYTNGFPKTFGIRVAAMNTDMVHISGATKHSVKQNFKKHVSSNKTARILMTTFAEKIA